MAKIGYKWGVHRRLSRDSNVAESLPETRLYQDKFFIEMLQKYGSVILKSGEYEMRWGGNRQIFSHIQALQQQLKGRLQFGKSHYLVQQRIDLVEISGRPMDVRVLVQRKKGSPWTVTAYVAKVAAKGLIVTNVARRATVLPLRQALVRSTMQKNAVDRAMKDLQKTALDAARCLGRSSPASLVAGFDMGVDPKGKVWMIEANPKPGYKSFLRLKDKTMYHRILRYPLGY